jgi:hypothetical protein
MNYWFGILFLIKKKILYKAHEAAIKTGVKVKNIFIKLMFKFL